MRFGTLLRDSGLGLAEVAILFHTPREPALRRALPWWAAQDSRLFNAYQNNHKPREEATLRNRRWAASFVAVEDADMVFAGLFEIRGAERWRPERFMADPATRAIAEAAREGTAEEWARSLGPDGRLVFDLRLNERLSDFIGRLVVARPAGRAYVRLAENLDLPILELARDSRLAPPAPEWRDFILTGSEVRSLPQAWAVRLAEWRGIYLIVDEADGARYVGSAYGETNLLGRWRTHVAGEAGVTVELRHRDPRRFRFSILERVSPDMPAEDVVRLEQTWMERLDTRRFGLNAGAGPDKGGLAERIVNG